MFMILVNIAFFVIFAFVIFAAVSVTKSWRKFGKDMSALAEAHRKHRDKYNY